MSRPRYKWWGYVKAVIRDQEKKQRELGTLRSAGGGGGRPTEARALRTLRGQRRREYDAVAKAAEITGRLPDGTERLRLVELVFWRQSHTLAGAALVLHISERTARRWHGEFIRLTASCMGLMD